MLLEPGNHVRLRHLTKQPHLNGELGMLLRWEATTSRWSVLMQDGATKKVKAENLRLDGEDDEDSADESWPDAHDQQCLQPTTHTTATGSGDGRLDPAAGPRRGPAVDDNWKEEEEPRPRTCWSRTSYRATTSSSPTSQSSLT